MYKMRCTGITKNQFAKFMRAICFNLGRLVVGNPESHFLMSTRSSNNDGEGGRVEPESCSVTTWTLKGGIGIIVQKHQVLLENK
ncbi:hypothetical protein MIDIC_550007 [Alphaproteobacteria bacterium]